jgi:hypothetical protein
MQDSLCRRAALAAAPLAQLLKRSGGRRDITVVAEHAGHTSEGLGWQASLPTALLSARRAVGKAASAVTEGLIMSADDWHRVEPVDVPGEGRVRSVTVDGRTVALARCGGSLGALENRCPHQGPMTPWLDTS